MDDLGHDNIPRIAKPRQEPPIALAQSLGLRTFVPLYLTPICNLSTHQKLAVVRLFLALLTCALPQRANAGPNAGAELDVTMSNPPCGLAGGSAIELAVAARNMSGVRQIKFELSWQPPDAVVSAVGALGAATEAEAFFAPGPPQIEGDRAEWGIAVFGGEGLAGEGVLAHFGFELSTAIDAATPVDIHLDAVSLGPSSAERDTVLPVQAVALANYCDEEDQPLQRGLFLRPQGHELLFSPMGAGRSADGSAGEALSSARLFDGGRFRIGESITWDIANRGSGIAYALVDGESVSIEANQVRQISSTSDRRGNAYLLLDAESGEGGQSTRVVLKACGDSVCGEGQVVWQSPITAVLEPADGPLPQSLVLAPNYPNPFNSSTLIPFAIPPGAARFARLDIFDLVGQLIATPFATQIAPGHHTALWNGYGLDGEHAASGLYIYRLSTGAKVRSRTMILLR